MDSEQIEMCDQASRNSRALEEMLLTLDDSLSIEPDEAEDVIRRCEQIIHCMQMFVK